MDSIQNRLDSFNRFQELREQALMRQQKTQTPREKLLDVIEQKKTLTEPALKKGEAQAGEKLVSPTASLIGKTLKTANELLLYDQKVNTTSEISGAKTLGNYVDMVG